MATTADRLMILGLDGATWTVFDPMRRLGLMPNLDALLQRSAYGTLRSTIPPVTSAAWTTMQTGCGPARHGVFDHRYYDATAGRMKVNHSRRVKVPTIWHLLSDAGRSVVSLNLPVTYPPLPIRGLVVSGMDAPHLDAALSKAGPFADRLRREVPEYQLRSIWRRAPEDVDELAENCQQTVNSFLGRAGGGVLADEMLPDWSVMMVQFQNLDPFQHRAWRCLNVDETGIDDPAWNIPARSVLKGMDRAIGRLLEVADRRGAAVMLVSDHGFGSCRGRISVNRILLDAGIAALPSRVTRRWFLRLCVTMDRLRLWNAKRTDPEARAASIEASVAAQWPFDWKRTLAFAPHQDTAAMIYLNTRERNRQGPLSTPRQIDEARLATAAALGSAMHPETGAPLFPKIVHTADEYGVDPAEQGYPDLIALPDEPYWVRTKLSSSKRWVEPDPNLPGTHRPEGIVALAGGGIMPGRTLKADLIDVAPTVLSLFGLPIPSHVEGHPLPCLGRLTTVRQDGPSPTIAGPHLGQFEYTPEEQRLIEKRLEELGYLE
jgi:predicted AlkP superfamily phosphohydrolase/phosphomutase